MEHIVQFAVGIDDERIAQSVTEHAEKKIIEDLKQAVANKLFDSGYYHRNANPETDKLSAFSERIVRDLLVRIEPQILDKAADLLAQKLARSKAGKEALQRAQEDR